MKEALQSYGRDAAELDAAMDHQHGYELPAYALISQQLKQALGALAPDGRLLSPHLLHLLLIVPRTPQALQG